MNNNGILIIGMPSLESQKYASPQSKAGHVNCKSGNEFRETMENYFSNCFLFSMNDEVVHTGYNKMAHYLIAVCMHAPSDSVTMILLIGSSGIISNHLQWFQ